MLQQLLNKFNPQLLFSLPICKLWIAYCMNKQSIIWSKFYIAGRDFTIKLIFPSTNSSFEFFIIVINSKAIIRDRIKTEYMFCIRNFFTHVSNQNLTEFISTVPKVRIKIKKNVKKQKTATKKHVSLTSSKFIIYFYKSKK